MVAYHVRDVGVAGSNPVIPTKALLIGGAFSLGMLLVLLELEFQMLHGMAIIDKLLQ